MNRIRELRERVGMSQSELARRIGCGQSTLSEIETGRIDLKLRRMEAIAEALNVPISDLFEPSSSAKKSAAQL